MFYYEFPCHKWRQCSSTLKRRSCFVLFPLVQECLFYSGDVAEDQYYCSASCDLDPCAEGEVCTLLVPGCAAGSICGNGYSCSAAPEEDEGTQQVVAGEEDGCEGRCTNFQVRGQTHRGMEGRAG